MINGHEISFAQGVGAKALWPELVPFVHQMTEVDDAITSDIISEKLQNSEALGWVVRDSKERMIALLVTEIVDMSTGKYLEVLFASGSDFQKWVKQMTYTLEAYVIQEDLRGIRAQCRPGVAKWLRQAGWKPVYELMEWKTDGI